MTNVRIGPDVAVFRLGRRRDTSGPEEISAAINKHVVGLISAEPRRSGNVLGVHVLGVDHVDPQLLFVSTDIGWIQHDQDAVDALSAYATVDELGLFRVVRESSAASVELAGGVPARDLGNRIGVYELRPTTGHDAKDVTASVATNLASLVGAAPTRSGNVQHVSLLDEFGGDRHLLIVGVDIGDSVRNTERLAAVGNVADIAHLGDFVQHQLATTYRGVNERSS